MFGINAVVSNHFKVLLGDMDNKQFNKISSRNCLNNQRIILMTVVMKGNRIAIIINNAGRGDNRSAKVSGNIFDNVFWIGKSRLGIDIEAIGAMSVDIRFNFLERVTDMSF